MAKNGKLRFKKETRWGDRLGTKRTKTNHNNGGGASCRGGRERKGPWNVPMEKDRRPRGENQVRCSQSREKNDDGRGEQNILIHGG